MQYLSSNSTSRSELVVETSASQLEWNQKQGKKGAAVDQEWEWISGGKPPGFWGRQEYEKHFETFFGGGSGAQKVSVPEYSLIKETKPKPGTCLAWGKVSALLSSSFHHFF